MLALSRKVGESIMIGNEIELTVIEVKGDQVRLGISAPRSISIHRKEIYLQIKKSNEEAIENTASIDDIQNLFS